MESSNKKISSNLSEKFLKNNPTCLIHNNEVLVVCLQETCNLRGGVCIKCLLSDHFKDHDQINIIPLKEYLEKLDEFLLSNKSDENISKLLENKIVFLDVLQNFQINSQQLIENLKIKINDKFNYYESNINIDENSPDYIYSEILKDSDQNTNVITKLFEFTNKKGLNYCAKNKIFINNSKNLNNKKLIETIEVEDFIKDLEELIDRLKKKLIITENNYYFKNFNNPDQNTVKMVKTNEGFLFKKIGLTISTYLIISDEILDFEKTIIWRIKPIHIPSKWLGIGILPKSKFKRDVWNSSDFIGINSDGYLLNRGVNISNYDWKVTTQSIITFTFEGPQRTIKLENSFPENEFIAKDLNPSDEWCLALFFHHPLTELLLF